MKELKMVPTKLIYNKSNIEVGKKYYISNIL